MPSQEIVLSEIDFVRLNKIAQAIDQDELLDLLDLADVTNTACIPHNLVTMNSQIVYARISDGHVGELTIVYPDNSDTTKNKLSVLSPMGQSFLGRYLGDIVACPLPDNKYSHYQILEIKYQPEAEGDFHL
jgi:regulator of nucleoside diphosphate kinase